MTYHIISPHVKWVYTCVVTAVIKEKKKKRVIPPGIEPGTLSVLDSRDNHYTMESYKDLIDDTLVCIHVHVAQSSIIAIVNKKESLEGTG